MKTIYLVKYLSMDENVIAFVDKEIASDYVERMNKRSKELPDNGLPRINNPFTMSEVILNERIKD